MEAAPEGAASACRKSGAVLPAGVLGAEPPKLYAAAFSLRTGEAPFAGAGASSEIFDRQEAASPGVVSFCLKKQKGGASAPPARRFTAAGEEAGYDAGFWPSPTAGSEAPPQAS